MPIDLQKDKNLVPTRIAASEVGYTTDYITLLAREGKIFATKIGRQWHVDLDEVLQFSYQQNKEQLSRRAQLKAERKIEYAFHTKNIEHAIALKIEEGKQFALFMAMVVVMLASMTSAFGYFSVHQDQAAALPTIDLSFLEDAAVALYEFVTPQEWYAKSDSNKGTGAAEGTDVQRSRSYQVTSVPSIEDEQAIIRDAFSDDLEVVFDAEVNDRGVIIPDFKSESDSEYRFRILLEEVLGSSS